MPIALRFIDVGFAQRADPVSQHVTRSRVDQAQWTARLVIFGRRYPVKALLGEEVGPAFELVGVKTMDVISKQLVQLPSPHDLVDILSRLALRSRRQSQ